MRGYNQILLEWFSQKLKLGPEAWQKGHTHPLAGSMILNKEYGQWKKTVMKKALEGSDAELRDKFTALTSYCNKTLFLKTPINTFHKQRK